MRRSILSGQPHRCVHAQVYLRGPLCAKISKPSIETSEPIHGEPHSRARKPVALLCAHLRDRLYYIMIQYIHY